MSMLGLSTLPVNHRLHPIYRAIGGIVGVLLVVFAILGFVVSGDVLGAPASNAFSAICLIAGIVMILATLIAGTAWLRSGPLAPHWSVRSGTKTAQAHKSAQAGQTANGTSSTGQ